jgi:low affinity Fe/Cu permease
MKNKPNEKDKKQEHTEGVAKQKGHLFERFASGVTEAAGSNLAFVFALGSVLLWLIAGPFFHYSVNWQLLINTGTTIITFLMVFLIQKSQNKESLSIQLKLNELVAAHEFASNRLVNAENMTEEELKTIKKYYAVLSESSKKDGSLQQSHSIEEAHHNEEMKEELEEMKVKSYRSKTQTP